LPRLLLHFNLRDYGRLYEMIHVINGGTWPYQFYNS
jgi:hypothetical protein